MIADSVELEDKVGVAAEFFRRVQMGTLEGVADEILGRTRVRAVEREATVGLWATSVTQVQAVQAMVPRSPLAVHRVREGRERPWVTHGQRGQVVRGEWVKLASEGQAVVAAAETAATFSGCSVGGERAGAGVDTEVLAELGVAVVQAEGAPSASTPTVRPPGFKLASSRQYLRAMGVTVVVVQTEALAGEAAKAAGREQVARSRARTLLLVVVAQVVVAVVVAAAEPVVGR